MAVTPGNLALGPGALYVADFGTTEPLQADVADPPGAGWTDVGGTLGGLTLAVASTWKELEVDQLTETPERRRTKKETTLATQLAEVTFTNLTLAMAGGATSSGAGYEQWEPDDDNSGDSPTYKAVIFDGFGGSGLRRRVIIRKALSTEDVTIANSKEDQTVYPVTFTSHYVSSAIRSLRILNEVAGSV